MAGTAAAPPGGGGFLERYFKFDRHGTTLGRDTMAGVTTFVVMSYIIFVNPQILSFAGIEDLSERGLPFSQVLAATCLVAGAMTILMGLYTTRPTRSHPASASTRSSRSASSPERVSRSRPRWGSWSWRESRSRSSC
jgi:hypothetical protein